MRTRFLTPGDILICDNTSIHLTEENQNLVGILWGEQEILVLHLPSYSQEFKHIALVKIQLLGQGLYHSNTKHKSRDTKYDDYCMWKCVEVLESTFNDNIRKNRKNFKKCGYNIYNIFL